MAEEEPTVNGEQVDNPTAGNGEDDDKEKARLIRENEETNVKIKLLLDEIEGLKTDRVEMKRRLDERLEEKQKAIDESEHDKRLLEQISSRAADLETEVSRLQHDLGSTMSENEDYKNELNEMKRSIDELMKVKSSLEEKEEEYEKKIAELEEKVESYESKISEKESENGVWKKEKEEKETQVVSLHEELKNFETKVEVMEDELNELRGKLEDYKQNNYVNVVVRDECGKETTSAVKGLRDYWPVALASTGLIAVVVAAVHVSYARRN